MVRLLTGLLWGDEGQDLIEYGLLAAFISVVAVTTITSVGTSLQGFWQQIVDAF